MAVHRETNVIVEEEAARRTMAAVVLYRLISFGFIIGVGWISRLLLRRTDRVALVPRPAVPETVCVGCRPDAELARNAQGTARS